MHQICRNTRPVIATHFCVIATTGGLVAFVGCHFLVFICIFDKFIGNCCIVITGHKCGYQWNILTQDNFAIFINVPLGRVNTLKVIIATDHIIGHTRIQGRDTALGIILIFILQYRQTCLLQHQVCTANIGYQCFVHLGQSLFVCDAILVNR